MPYRPLTPAELRPLLLLAPHPDDEVLACGGLLALAAAQRLPTRVVIVSDGAAGGQAVERAEECRDAARVLGYAGPEFWNLPDRGVVADEALITRILRTLDAGRAEWLLAPSPFEIHPDHRAVCVAGIEACRRRPSHRLGFYEVGQALMPNALVDITAVQALKARAMACFTSQLGAQAYDEQITALNRYRAYTLGPAVTHAEALWFPPAAAVQGGVAGLLAEVDGQLRRRLMGG